MANFKQWYGLDDLTELEEEYASVKLLLANVALLEETPEVKKELCADEVTEIGSLPWNGVTDYKCKEV